MADEEQLAVIRQGSDAWNAWREQNPDVRVDLSGANLSGLNLSKANLEGANLHRAKFVETNLVQANLEEANLEESDLTQADLRNAWLYDADLPEANLTQALLSGADLSSAGLARANLMGASLSRAHLFDTFLLDANLTGASLKEANLFEARLTNANLRGADLSRAILIEAYFSGANLSGANLSAASLVGTDFTHADLTGCRVYGISAWDLKLDGANQKNLIITRGEPEITVDNLEVAQFIYVLLNNERVRHVIDTITSKVVLILGRFTDERKEVLDALREELRKRDYTPVLFDFPPPESKDLTGTVQTLANMARFIIADVTDPSSVPHELATVVPGTMVPVQLILLEGEREYAMLVDLKRRHHWVLEPYRYASPEQLIANLSQYVIAPADAKARELRGVSPPTG
jgi:uncharacterized protein YjbI with pentapeptide repeats